MGDELAYPWSAALVRKLLARGLDPNRPDWLGKTFLHACAESGNRSVAAVFLDAGADINARGLEFNETPLAAAVRYRAVVQRRDRPSWPSAGDGWSSSCSSAVPRPTCPMTNRGRLRLAWARKLGLADIEEILLKHGAT